MSGGNPYRQGTNEYRIWQEGRSDGWIDAHRRVLNFCDRGWSAEEIADRMRKAVGVDKVMR